MNNNERDVRGLFTVLGINYSSRTEEALESIIGEKLDYEVLKYIILEEKSALLNLAKKNMPQSYRFGALKIMVQNKYVGVKNALALLAD